MPEHERPRGVLRVGDRVRFEDRVQTVVGLSGTTVRLVDEHNTASMVMFAHLMASDGFELLDCTVPTPGLPPFGLLDTVPEVALRKARFFESHLIEAETGLPPDAPKGTVPRPEYDPQWPAVFEREADRIRAALGDGVVRLEHTGSTSVPGLAAKPIIDITLLVRDSADEPAYVPALEAAGYVLRIREPHWHEHRVFKGPDTDVNLHVFTDGSVEFDRMVGFRDWLRAHPEDRDLYLRTKRELAARTWRHVQHYADAKTAVVEEIIARAGLPPRVD